MTLKFFFFLFGFCYITISSLNAFPWSGFRILFVFSVFHEAAMFTAGYKNRNQPSKWNIEEKGIDIDHPFAPLETERVVQLKLPSIKLFAKLHTHTHTAGKTLLKNAKAWSIKTQIWQYQSWSEFRKSSNSPHFWMNSVH